MRIAFLIHSLGIGGAERQLTVLSKGLHDRGHDVVVIVFYSGGPLESELIAAGVRIRSLNKRGRWDVHAIGGRLLRFVRQENPDLLYAFDGTPNLAGLLPRLLLQNLKVVWGIRCSDMDWAHYDGASRFISALMARMAGFAHALIANSNAGMRHYASQGYPREKMVVIPNGVDTLRFRPDQALRSRVRAEWGVAEHEVLIGLVARLDPMKDHVTFVHSAARIAKQRSGVRFVCVGDGPAALKNSLKLLTEELGLGDLFLWVGARIDMPAVQNALDVAVSSSAYGEGISNAISEAMACGTPCVVTNVGDSSWIVGPIGEVVPPKNPEALSVAILSVLDQRPYDYGLIRQRIIDHMSITTLLTRTESVLNAVLQNSHLNASEHEPAALL